MTAAPRITEIHETPLTRGSLLRVDGELHHVLALLEQGVLLAHVATARLYIAPDVNGIIGLPSAQYLDEFIASGRAELVDGIVVPDEGGVASPPPACEIEKVNAECDLLEEAGISNGAKAMAIFLHANWRGDLLKRFGPHTPVATLKRWRTLRSRNADPARP